MAPVYLLESDPEWRTLLAALLRSLGVEALRPGESRDPEAPHQRVPVLLRHSPPYQTLGALTAATRDPRRWGVPILALARGEPLPDLAEIPTAVILRGPITREKLDHALRSARSLDEWAPPVVSPDRRGRVGGTSPPALARHG